MSTPFDQALRGRIQLLGRLLGDILRDREGRPVLDAVETLRKGFSELRRQPDDAEARERLTRFIAALNPEILNPVVRAFNTYFSLSNIVEEEFQHQQRREQVRSGAPLWRGSFDETLRSLHAAGVTVSQLQTLLNQISFMPVFTAHPTEAKRRVLLRTQRQIFLTNLQLDNPALNALQQQEVLEELRGELQILWHTDEVRSHKPQVRDEIKNGLYYFRESIFQALPALYRNLERALNAVYGHEGGKAAVRIPCLLRFGSWIGGDRDGNPFVTPDTTALALRLQSQEILREYLRRVLELNRSLTYSGSLVTPSPPFSASLDADARRMATLFRDPSLQYAQEPYRRKLFLMYHRLQHNLDRLRARIDGRPDATITPFWGYDSAQEFLDDLYLIRDSLVAHGDSVAADGELKDLIRLAEAFGFHLAALDVRQESGRHTAAVAEIFAMAPNLPDYTALSEEERLSVLGELLAQPGTPLLYCESFSPATQETLDVFRVMARMSAEIGPRAFDTYVISMTHEASHVHGGAVSGQLCRAGRSSYRWRLALRGSGCAAVRDHCRFEAGECAVDSLAGSADLSGTVDGGGWNAGRDAGLFRLLQGRRHSGFKLGPVSGPAAGGGTDGGARIPLSAVSWARRHGGTRRRPGSRRHSGAAAGHGARLDQDHRTGRSAVV
jgi:phosphoenolpyruvate carboxylase